MKDIQLSVPETDDEVWAVTFRVLKGKIKNPVVKKYKVAYWECHSIYGLQVHLYQPGVYGSNMVVNSSQIFVTEAEANKYLESLK